MLAETRRHDELPLPETVQGIIAARLDALPPDEKQLLQDAAVLGKVFWLGARQRGRRARAARGRGAPARARAQGVRPPRAPLVGRGRRASTRSGTCSFATSPTAQIPRAGRAERHRRAAGVDRVARPARGPRRDACPPLPRGASARARAAGAAKSAGAASSAPGVAARDAGDRALALGAFPAAARSVRGGARALAGRRRAAAASCCSPMRAAASTTPRLDDRACSRRLERSPPGREGRGRGRGADAPRQASG